MMVNSLRGMGATTIIGPDGLPLTINDSTGSGECVNGYDEYGVACADWSAITSNPATTAAAINYLYGPSGQAASSGVTAKPATNNLLLIGLAVFALFMMARR